MTVENLVVGELQTNCYIISSGAEAVIIDPGAEPQQILDILKSKGLNLKYIINTHGHFDHVEANNELAKATRAIICVHKQDRGWVNAQKDLEEGEDLNLKEIKLKVIHTPGHTPGSISILVENSLFTGDLIFEGSVGRTDLPGGSWEDLNESLKRISSLPDSIRIYPGHGPKTSIGDEKKNNPFLKNLVR